jgi:hypothetical protein
LSAIAERGNKIENPVQANHFRRGRIESGTNEERQIFGTVLFYIFLFTLDEITPVEFSQNRPLLNRKANFEIP